MTDSPTEERMKVTRFGATTEGRPWVRTTHQLPPKQLRVASLTHHAEKISLWEEEDRGKGRQASASGGRRRARGLLGGRSQRPAHSGQGVLHLGTVFLGRTIYYRLLAPPGSAHTDLPF